MLRSLITSKMDERGNIMTKREAAIVSCYTDFMIGDELKNWRKPMREILFRGKRIDNGEWVYGAYMAHDYDGHTILNQNLGVGTLQGFEVIPETVGQYTGLKDKNGKEIYEGDIVIAWSQGYQATGEVKQRIDGLWLMYPAYQHGKQWGLCPNPKGGTTVEIIGNIYENPELMV